MLEDENGVQTSSIAGIASITISHLSNTVGKERIYPGNYEEWIVSFFGPMGPTRKGCALVREALSQQEVEFIVRLMDKGKAPGPNGIPIEFMQYYRELVGSDLTSLLNEVCQQGVLPDWMNKGMVRLIPKGFDRLHPKDWRPITLLNLSYKVLAKLLATQIKFTLPRLLNERQFGFLQGRSINDATLVSLDLALTTGKQFILCNLDLEKAYDRIHWDFILRTMEKIGFGSRFLAFTNCCVYKWVTLRGFSTPSLHEAR